MGYRPTATLLEDGFAVHSYGHGAAYLLVDLDDGRELWFQDAAADVLLDEFEKADAAGVARSKVIAEYFGMFSGGEAWA